MQMLNMSTFSKRTFLALGLLASLLFAFVPHQRALADDSISVTGEATVKVVPDEVIIALGIETWDLNLATAKQQNDAIINKLKDMAAKYAIKPEQLQTDFVNIEPRYNNDYAKREFLGFFVRKTLVITLRDITKFDGVLSDALTAGANYVHGIEFRTTQLRKYRDQARTLAINAAREKAEALAKELGRKVSKPLTISENGGGWYSSYGSWWGSRYGGGQMQNVIQNASGAGGTGGAGSGTDADGESTLALGQISVNASVSVTFALEPETKP